MISPTGIRVVDALYRVSTRAQEAEGESLFNQRREVEEKWARPNGITVRKRIEVAESGKGALRLSGAGFKFHRRAEYAELITEYQNMPDAQRPDAIVIDWADRWSRNVLEYAALTTAFRMLNIRLLAIGDGLDLTDPRNDLVTHVKAAIGQEQLRIIKLKVSEARRSRRERGKWQGGTVPDGYRTHEPACPGLIETKRENLDGKTHAIKIRACRCDPTVLYRDPVREPVIAYIWKMLETSPLSWAAMADELNARGFRRPSGAQLSWGDVYRIGENPHYGGGLTTDRFDRSPHDGQIKRRKPLSEQTILWDSASIPQPYVSRETFEAIHARRFNKITRNLPRAARGNTSELLGILFCPECGRQMASLVTLSPLFNRNGKPRKSPRKRYPNMQCSHAKKHHPTCGNRNQVRVATISRLLINHLANVVRMSDSAILAAMKLRQSETSLRALEQERRRLQDSIIEFDKLRRTIQRMVAAGAQTQQDAERDLFHHQREKVQVEARIREIDLELSRQHAKPDFERARSTVSWLAAHWDDLTVREKAEALRLLVSRVSYVANDSAHPEVVRIERYGPAFVQPAVVDQDRQHTRKASSR